MQKPEFDAAFRKALDEIGMAGFAFESFEHSGDEPGGVTFDYLTVRVDSPDGDLHDMFHVKNDDLTPELVRECVVQTKAVLAAAGGQ